MGGFFKFIFWIIVLLLVAAAVLYWLNKPLFMKLLKQVTGKHVMPTHKKKAGVGQGGMTQSSALEQNQQSLRSDCKANQALVEIKAVQHKVDEMMTKLDALSENVDKLYAQVKMLQEQSTQRMPVPATSQQMEPVAHRPAKVASPTPPQLRYAFTPSSTSPYGFKQDDWSAVDKEQTFVMKMISDSEARFTINNKAAVYSQVLNNLAYLDRLIEYENLSGEGVMPSHIQKIIPGRLYLQDTVWTIKSKILIKIN